MKPTIITFAVCLLLILRVSLAYADEPEVIDVQHDTHRQVTCWIIAGTGISCLPDSQLRQPAKAATNPASAPAPRQHDERVQL
jgi:hypothetical protein